MYTVSDLKDSISGILSGVNLNNVTNLYGALERATRVLVQKANIPETMGRESVILYDKVYDYSAPTNIFGGALIDFRPQGDSRTNLDYAYRKPVELFDRNKHILPNGFMVTFEHNKGSGIMRVVSPLTKQAAILDPMTDKTGWTAGGNASTAVNDETVFYRNPASLRFSISAGGTTGSQSRTLTSQLDLTDYSGVGVGFLAVYFPANVSNITSITLRIGNDASNYWQVTNTAGFIKAFTASEWNIVDFDLSTATTTGTVDATKIDYVNVLVNYDGTTLTNVRFGELWASLPLPCEVLYASAAIFLASGSNPSTSITTDSDNILIGDAGFSILEYEGALCVLQQSGGTLSSPMAQTIKAVLHGDGRDLGLYSHYRAQNPSEELRNIGNYYDDNL